MRANGTNDTMSNTQLYPLLAAWIVLQSGCSPSASPNLTDSGESGVRDSGVVEETDRGETVLDGGETAETDTGPDASPAETDDGGCLLPRAIDSGLAVDMDPSDDSLFEVRYELSPKIGTVGVVEWSVSEPIDSASVVLGPAKGAFEHTGQIDLNEPGHKTLLLGLKPDTTYKFAIVAHGTRIYTSPVYEITTGPQRTGLPIPAIHDEPGCGVRLGGFTIGCIDGRIGSGDTSSTVYIYDQDGDHVWWYDFPVDDCARARMSFDGKRMWGGNANVTGNKGALFSVTMDGTDERLYTSDNVPGMEKRHHDFAVLENGNILYFERDPLPPGKGATPFGTYINDEADTIYELDPVTLTKTRIYYESDDFEAAIKADGSHTNAISFVPHLDAVAFSMKNLHTIAVVSYPEGALLATYGGPESDFDGMVWDTQHDFQVLEDGLVLFNNNGGADGSAALKYTIEAGTEALDWAYSPGVQSNTWGSAVQLPNGNFLVVFSNNSLIHELNPEGELLQSTEIADITYVVRRASLYGPPPPWDR